MTETEKDMIDRFEKYLYENTLSKEFYVSLLKLAVDQYQHLRKGKRNYPTGG
jgi:hypothetical protein